MSKLVSNYLFNVLYQFLILVLPILSTPYVARVLKPEGIGINSYSTSVVQIFMFFAMLGIQVYGSKQIASVNHRGKKDLSEQFWSIYSIQLLSSTLCIGIYLLFVAYYIHTNQSIFFIQTFVLLGALLDISWFFMGIEELKKVVLRNTVVKIVALALIFILVKEPQDLYLYILINVLTNVIGQGIMWSRISRYVVFIPISIKYVITHLKPIMMLFLPLIFVQIYGVYNKVWLGIVSTNTAVGFYDQAVKIVYIGVTVVASLGSVMLPRISSEYAKGNHANINRYAERVLRFVLFITAPMCVGLIAVSEKLVPWFLGSEYSEVIGLIKIISPIIIFIGCANVFSMQILIPTNQQGKYTISVAIAAIMSLIVNIGLAGSLGSAATAIALLVAEGVGALILAIFVRDFINFKSVFNYAYKYFLASTIAGAVVYGIGTLISGGGILITCFQILLASIVYIILMILIKDEFILIILKRAYPLLNLKRFKFTRRL